MRDKTDSIDGKQSLRTGQKVLMLDYIRFGRLPILFVVFVMILGLISRATGVRCDLSGS